MAVNFTVNILHRPHGTVPYTLHHRPAVVGGGGFAGAVSALWILGATMQSLSDALAELPKHALYLDKYFAFLDHENRMVSGTCPSNSEIIMAAIFFMLFAFSR